MYKLYFFLIFAMLLLSVTATAQLPTTISYQGFLSDSLGQPLNGTMPMTFRFFNDSTGGASLNTQSYSGVPVNNGVYSVVIPGRPDTIGPIGPRPLGQFIEVEVNGQVMSPRMKLTSVPYAMTANTVLGPGSSANDSGAIAMGTKNSANGRYSIISGGSDNKTGSGIIAKSTQMKKPSENLKKKSSEKLTKKTETVRYPGNGDYSEIGGGSNNIANGDYSTIGGGEWNTIANSGYGSVIAGGSGGFIKAVSSFIGGGEGNEIGDDVSGDQSVIGGGGSNRVFAYTSVISGGNGNLIDNPSVSGTIGGGEGNTVEGLIGTIGGGTSNFVKGEAGTVAGGIYNEVISNFSIIAGGSDNLTSGNASVITGGTYNRARGDHSFIGGGGGTFDPDLYEVLDSNSAIGDYTVICGGLGNLAIGLSSTIGGGSGNQTLNSILLNAEISGNGISEMRGSKNNDIKSSKKISFNPNAGGNGATIGGGYGNITRDQATTISGGGYNHAEGPFSTVSGGGNNRATGTGASIGGGDDNIATGYEARVSGGGPNRARGDWSVVGGGGGLPLADSNSANGHYSTVPGGRANKALGGYSFAAGFNAKAVHGGTFVWADAYGTEFVSTAGNQFSVRASGGTRIYSNVSLTAGVTLAAGGSSWSAVSDRNMKENFQTIDGEKLLKNLGSIPILTWNYKAQDQSIRHIGPMAQDFYAAFNVGEDDKHITTIDADGVALAAIQELIKQNEQLSMRLIKMEATIKSLVENANSNPANKSLGELQQTNVNR